jgi:hypothetical protein
VKPSQFRRDGDEFLAVWETAGIGLGFSRIRETDSGMLYAELDVQSIRPDARGTLLSPSRFNLMAATERKRLAELLTNRAPDVSWNDALESAIGMVIAGWRTPEPLVDLWDVPDPGENRYLIYPWLVENDTNLWYADEQSLKSYLSMVCAASIVSGHGVPAIGTPTRQGPVLLYDWETFDGKQRRRLTRVANGLGRGALRQIHYRQMTRPLVDMAAQIRAEVSRLGAVLVIFDSLGWMCGGDLNKPEISIPTMTAVASLTGTTRLVLAHHGKAGRGSEGDPTVFGSGFFEFASRNRWLIRKAQDEDSDVVRIGLYHKKASDDQRHTSRGLAFTFDRTRDAVSVDTCSIEDAPELLRDASPSDKIVAMLRETEFSKATVKDISKETKIPEGSVKRHLIAMDGQRVQRVSVNGYAGGRGHAAEWALLAKPFTANGNSDEGLSRTAAPETVQKTVHPIDRESMNGFSPLRGETVHSKPFKTVHSERFRGNDVDDEIPF